MDNEEFQELKEFHLSKPNSMIKSPFKDGRGRMNDLYSEVREKNWQRECEKIRNEYARENGLMD
jgi:hypothetical protein